MTGRVYGLRVVALWCILAQTVSTAVTAAQPTPVAAAAYHASRGHAQQHPRATATATHKQAQRPAPHRLLPLRLTLAISPARPVSSELLHMTATLGHPLNDGRVTITWRPTVPGLSSFSCTPVHGRCVVTWSTRDAGQVTAEAHWSGNRDYKPASATLYVTVARARYTYYGMWGGDRVGPLTSVEPAITVSHLPGAAHAGHLTRFHTDDPNYRCLNGRSLDVYTAPRAYSDDYVAVYGGERGGHCAAGTWLYPQGPGVSAQGVILGKPGGVITVHGSFPSTRPDDPMVQLFDQGQLVATVSVLSWSAHAVTVHAPTHLSGGAYTLHVSWYDRLTGTTVRSAGLTVRFSASHQPSPAPTNNSNPPATDVPVMPGLPEPPAALTTQPRPASTSVPVATSAPNLMPMATATTALPPSTTASNTSVPAPPPATSVPAPPPISTPIQAPTSTPIPTDTPTSTATSTPTTTSTATPTSTPIPSPTWTATALPPTPTSTHTPSSTPTATAPVLPPAVTTTATSTPSPTATSMSTVEPRPTATNTLAPSSTASTPTSIPATSTSTTIPSSPTASSTASNSPTASTTATSVSMATATSSPVATPAPGCTASLPSTISSNTELMASPCNTYVGYGTTVQSGATLTVDPGVIVEFNSGALNVAETLHAIGTASQPIIFTSNQTNPAPGDWDGIQTTAGGNVMLTYTTISDAGRGSYSALNLQNSVGDLDHVTITSNQYTGVYADTTSAITITHSMITISVANQGGTGIDAQSPATATVLHNDSIATNSGSNALELGDPNSTANLANMTYSGNGFDGVVLDGGTLNVSATWMASSIGAHVLLYNSLTVGSGATLSVLPGETVESNYSALTIAGSLSAVGTAGQPITFTSSQTSPSPGDWYGIQTTAGGSTTMSYTAIEYAGRSSYPALNLHNSAGNFDHVTIAASQYTGISTDATSALTVTHSTVTAGTAYYGGDGINAQSPATATVLHDDSITTNGNGNALELGDPNVTADLANMTYSGTGLDGVALDGGTLNVPATWTASAMGTHILLYRNLTVSVGNTLTVSPGETVTSNYSALNVAGSLSAVGTESQPITFTSSQVTPVPGNWGGIQVTAGGSATLSYATISYAGNNSALSLQLVFLSTTAS